MELATGRVSFALSLVLILAVTTGSASTLAPHPGGDSFAVLGGGDCADGVVKDDGSPETGYGWVPAVVDGRYIQRFEVGEFQSRMIEEVCICWTHTRADDEVSFTVELYRDQGGVPAAWPEASVQAVAAAVPTFPDGAFTSVDVSDAEMQTPTDVFYVGVRWDPSVDEFFFVCVDQSDTTPVVDGFYIDDEADEWTSVLESNDPIFDEHRAMMIRARAAEGYFPRVPTAGPKGLATFVVLIACIGVALLVRRLG